MQGLGPVMAFLLYEEGRMGVSLYGIIYLVPPVHDAIKAACGVLPSKPSLAEKLLRERNGGFKQCPKSLGCPPLKKGD